MHPNLDANDRVRELSNDFREVYDFSNEMQLLQILENMLTFCFYISEEKTKE